MTKKKPAKKKLGEENSIVGRGGGVRKPPTNFKSTARVDGSSKEPKRVWSLKGDVTPKTVNRWGSENKNQKPKKGKGLEQPNDPIGGTTLRHRET